jgi:hypothetical protein
MVSNVALLSRRLFCLSQHRNAKDNVEKRGDFEKKDTVSSIWSAGKDEGLDQNTITVTTITPAPTLVSTTTTAAITSNIRPHL